MQSNKKSKPVCFSVSLFVLLIMTWLSHSAIAEEYEALKGVNQVNVVFDVTQGDPKAANIVFWAVRDLYNNENVRALPEPPKVAVVFHGESVKLLSSNREDFDESEKNDVDAFAGMIQQMKKDGVKLEICSYAAKVFGVDPATIMPEIDQVGNGFVSVAGYQAQGYSLVTVK